MFLAQSAPSDVDCGRNLDLLIQALPRIEDAEERQRIANRAVGLIRQSHPSWSAFKGESDLAWELFLAIAPFDPKEHGIQRPEKPTPKHSSKPT